MTTVETCTCGASITVSSRYSYETRYALSDWREQHRHCPTEGSSS